MAHMNGFKETLAPPQGHATSVEHAPGLQQHESKRTDVVFKQETEMVGAMQELRIQTVEKNAEFHAAVIALHERVDVAWEKLRREVEDRSQQFDAVKHLVSTSLLDLAEGHRTDFDNRMSRIEDAGVSAAHAKCDQLSSVEQQTYFHEVPALVQRLIGPARQQMQTSHEAFDVENTKVLARERRLQAKIEAFNATTQRRVAVECEDRMRQFHMAAEQLSGQLLQPVRLDRQRQRSTVMHGVRGIQLALGSETSARKEADAFVADSLAKATERLQRTVLENFGSMQESDSDDQSEGSASDSD